MIAASLRKHQQEPSVLITFFVDWHSLICVPQHSSAVKGFLRAAVAGVFSHQDLAPAHHTRESFLA